MKPTSGAAHSRSSFHLVMKSKLQLHTMPPRLVHGIRLHAQIFQSHINLTKG